MRQKLKDIGSETRERYKATIGRCGIMYNTFKNAPERTIVLKEVTLVGEIKPVTDHLWVTVGKTLSELNLKAGDVITFSARVGIYKKGSHLKKRDYKLNRMTKIEVQRADRKLTENEITSGNPATFEEWNDIQDMKYLEKEYPEEYEPIGSDFELKDLERLKELKSLFKRRYFDTGVKTV